MPFQEAESAYHEVPISGEVLTQETEALFHEMLLHEMAPVLSESEEIQLATELLSVTNEAELDRFLGGLFKRVWRGVRKIAKPLGGILRRVAKVALPIAGKVVGGFFGGPLGGVIGGKLGSLGSKLLEAEMSGLSPEVQSFEIARRFVRLASSAARNAALAPANSSPPAVAKAAVLAAARKHAPGLLRGAPASISGVVAVDSPVVSVTGRGGRWIRRGRNIIILGA